MSDQFLKTLAASQYLGVSRSSLTSWIRQGVLSPGVTPGGHYRFSIRQLNEFAAKRGLDLPARPSANSEPFRILLAGGDNSFRELVSESLEIFSGCEFRASKAGLQGAMLLGAWKPDLVILDIRMPDMDGLELLRLIRENPETETVHVIAASAHPTPEIAASLAALKPDSILEKPVRIAKMIESVQKVLSMHRL